MRPKARARRHGRSLQSEAKSVLEQAAGLSSKEVAAMLGRWKQRLGNRQLTDSVALIREDGAR